MNPFTEHRIFREAMAFLPWFIVMAGGTLSFISLEQVQAQLHEQQALTSKRILIDEDIRKSRSQIATNILRENEEARITRAKILAKAVNTEADLRVTRAALLAKVLNEDEHLRVARADILSKAVLQQCLGEYRTDGYLESLAHDLTSDSAHSGLTEEAKKGRSSLSLFYNQILKGQSMLKCHQ
jgi:hypothetical protein